jgi:Zn-dependent peptidase ImmA (M78 family)/transcriptional regulator with XRE-family HTH domain
MSDRFNHEMVQLARESRGWTQQQLAEASKLTQGFISRLEAGEKIISKEKLRSLAEALRYPPGFFFQQERYEGLGISVVFYRKKAGARMTDLRRLQAEINLHRIFISKIFACLDVRFRNTFQFMDVDEYQGDAEKIASLVRASWNLPFGPVVNLVKAIEGAGGIVFSFPFGTKDIDAISQWPNDGRPLFFINSEVPADRIRFSLAHELGHMVMHRSASDVMEAEANRFASEFLMPAREIKPQLVGINLPKAAQLKPYWRTSMAALIYRAKELGTISQAEYAKLFQRMSHLGIRKSEPGPLPPEEPNLIPELFNTYCIANALSIADLSRLSTIYEDEFRARFVPRTGLRIVQ